MNINKNLVRYLKYGLRFIRSFYWDLRVFFSHSLRRRAQYGSFQTYKRAKLYPDFMHVGDAIKTIEPLAKQYCKGRGIDVGASIWPLDGARPVENHADENAYRIRELDESLDYVFSSHTVEHLDEIDKAIKEWARVIKPGGILFLYIPHPACSMWNADVFEHHVWDVHPEEIEKIISKTGELTVIENSRVPDVYFSYHVVAKKH